MNKELKDFIKEHKEEIDNNEWEKVYKSLNEKFNTSERFSTGGQANTSDLVGQFTEMVLETGINPLNYMLEIPCYFACNSNIESINIPTNITSIDFGAFWGCKKLTDITIPNNVKSIGRCAFLGCGFTSIKIPDNGIVIGDYAFSNCKSLTNMMIPSSVTSIGESMFGGSRKLTKITFGGTKQQWKNIKKKRMWYVNDGMELKIACTDGNIRLGDKLRFDEYAE